MPPCASGIHQEVILIQAPVDPGFGTDDQTAAVVRDTLYIDGGALWWTPGMKDGSYAPPTSDGKKV